MKFIIAGISLLIVIITFFITLYEYRRRRRYDYTLNLIKKENEEINYYLKNEVSKDEWLKRNLNSSYINNTHFQYIDAENQLKLEIYKLRNDIKQLNNINKQEIKSLKNNIGTETINYKELLVSISEMTNIHYLLELLQTNKDEHFKYVKNVLAEIVHTIRNPISGMKAILILIEMENLSETFREKINDMRRYIDEIENNLNAYYYISHIESELLHDNNDIDIKDILHNRVKLIVISSGKKINIEEDLCDFLMPREQAQVLVLATTCVLENSISFSQDNGTISINSYIKDGMLHIEILNDGPIIEKEIIDRIFEKGFSTRGSSGLGLNIAKRAIEETLNGIIVCENIGVETGVKFNIVTEVTNE